LLLSVTLVAVTVTEPELGTDCGAEKSPVVEIVPNV
jgi:hypothetical protein